MRIAIRSVMVSLFVATAMLVGTEVSTPSDAIAFSPRVIILDNDGNMMPRNMTAVGQWGFGPATIAVTQGETITFDSPSTNVLPHTVTSINAGGTAFTRTLSSGATFNSSPTMETLIRPGQTYQLDTSVLEPGYYAYYCALHPWMLGNIVVLAP